MRRTMFRSVVTLVALAVLPHTSRAQVFCGRVLDQESRQPVLVAAVLLVDFFYVVRGVGMRDSVGLHEDWHPQGFRDRSQGIIDVRVYCER